MMPLGHEEEVLIHLQSNVLLFVKHIHNLHRQTPADRK